MTGRTRIAYWDVAKAIAIFCVVWGHCLQNMTTDTDYWLHDSLSQFIISWHMPLFMVISGYFAYYSFSKPFLTTMLKKTRQLIIPSVSWYIIIALMAMLFHRDFRMERVTDILVTLPYSMWFLKSLFMCYFITMLGNLLYRWHPWTLWGYIILIITLGEWLNYASTISMLPFFLVGVLWHRYEKLFSRYACPISIVCLIAFAFMASIWNSSDYNVYLHPFKHELGGVQAILIRFIIGTTGACSILYAVKYLSEKYSHSVIVDMLSKLGTLTLGIYCIQVIWAEGLVKSFQSDFCAMNPFKGGRFEHLFYDYVLTLFTSILAILACCVMIKLLRKTRVTRLVLLGESL